MTLVTKISLGVVAALSSALDLASADSNLDLETAYRWASGTGANQADRLWHDTRTIAASSNEDLDMAGSLTDALGGSFVLARVKAFAVVAASGNSNNVNVSRPAANGVPWALAAGDGVPIRPGGMLALAAPDATAYAVTAGTGDLINIANSGAGSSVTYKIVIVGASA